jgi:hypothetical protein
MLLLRYIYHITHCSSSLHPSTFDQIRFALTSSPVFSKTDKVTDSERFYNSIFGLFGDIDEKAEVDELIVWWNR